MRIISICVVGLLLGIVSAANANLINGSFEDPSSSFLLRFLDEKDVPGWETTASDNKIELWKSGFNGVDAYDGNYFAELNANMVSDLYQYVDGFNAGDVVDWSFAHRARTTSNPTAVDKLGFIITEYGSDGMLGTIDDVIHNIGGVAGFSDPGDKWYEKMGTFTVVTTSMIEFKWTSLGYTSNSIGNFLDGAKFELHRDNPVPEPGTLLLFGVGIVGFASARIRRRK